MSKGKRVQTADGPVLVKHTTVYLVARGLPGLVNFAAIAVYTRVLGATEYGRYALVIAGAGLANALLFEWLRLGVIRFFPSHGMDHRARFYSTVAAGYLGLALLSGLLGAVGLSLQPGLALSQEFWILGLGLLWAQAYFELNLSLLAVQLAPLRYGLVATGKALLALLIATGLALAGWGARGLIVGLAAGMVLPTLPFLRKDWLSVRPRLVDWSLLAEVIRYGLPLSVSIALGVIIFSLGRLMLQRLAGTEAVGLYAAAYDLTQQTITMLMMVVNLAAYPLVLHALERRGVPAAREQLGRQMVVLLAIALPATAGLALLRSSAAAVLLGPQFRAAGRAVIPAAAMAALLQGIKAYYLDQAFQLGRRTYGQIWPILAATILNVGLSVWWIPHLGVIGAAWAAVASYALALMLSWRLGQRVFPLPFPASDLGKVTVATGGMALVLWPLLRMPGLPGLVVQALAGTLAYGFLAWAVDLAGVRARTAEFVQRRLTERSE